MASRKLVAVLAAWTVSFSLARCAHAVDAPVADPAKVNKLVDQLAADDPNDRARAAITIEELPSIDLPLVQAADKRDDLPPDAKTRLHRALQRMEPRIKLRLKKIELAKVRNAWYEKMNLEFYDRDGHTNPAWDDAAKKVFSLDAKRGTVETHAELQPILVEEKKMLDQAIAAGCDDPALLTTAGLFAADTYVSANQTYAYFAKAQKAAADGKISPFTRVIIDGRFIRGIVSGAAGPRTKELTVAGGYALGDMVHQCVEAMNLPGIPPNASIDMVENVLKTASEAHAPLQMIFDKVFPPLEAAVPIDSSVLYVKGYYYVRWAWEARGGGFANTVTPQGWKDFADRLVTANEILTKASDMDPSNPNPPTEMMTVVLGQDGNRELMEKWFKRAMEADPDNLTACSSKIYYLEPKWHGDAEAMLEFGHQCLDEGNWASRIPFILMDAHIALAKYEQDPNLYYRHESVWSDVYSLYSSYLELYPKDLARKNQYCYYACLCGQWKVANKLFTELGINLSPALFGGENMMKDFQKRAAELGGAAAP